MKTKLLVLTILSCLALQAALIPGPIFSGDGTGWVASIGSQINPTAADGVEFAISPGSIPLPMSNVSAVSFSAAGLASSGTIVSFVDQWGLTPGTQLADFNFAASDPFSVWIDGGLGGIFQSTPGYTLSINLAGEQPGFHYFNAFVEDVNPDHPVALQYNLDPTSSAAAPEPGTWILLTVGCLLLLAGKLFGPIQKRLGR